ncbi:aminotransferase class I/II-fold pyridoxal phosphate-dependent enzyme [Fusibacter ferrireducens]|uniref:Aminotransferase class I/II-fold pyridoxal phosphate-dependent enzyme n=1 Tax=Fusibacter ferrireducens TaxID=2785058 RepID=A0ABR9ZZ93_9FIRM|nr:aminotransferase class I/II-fold pyridoxal phosphate-dependent enzyme [Fusibacter ferrireducens]MBF4695281.1 aminotransferase class I/II-fold pyridoxal phosphate-dependent enzyme [Fusibacter ferrireducens]
MIDYHKPYSNEMILTRVCEKIKENPFEDPYALQEALVEAFKKLPLYRSIKHVHFLNSATSALEVMALALKLKPEDEVILPSFTHVSTANAFARVGAKLKFVDIEPESLNLDIHKVEAAITEQTKVIIPIHYGGVNHDFEALLKLSGDRGITLLEDASHCINSGYQEKGFGLYGAMGCLSFHHTKNITSGGHGGCLFVADDQLNEDCLEIMHHGTNQDAFAKGRIQHYRWQQLGSEFMMTPYQMRFLLEALPYVEAVTTRRKQIWNRYRDALAELNNTKKIKCPTGVTGNGHLFYVLLNTEAEKNRAIEWLGKKGIQIVTHYQPLHNSPMGLKLGYENTDLKITESVARRIIRLPIHAALTDAQQGLIIEQLLQLWG